MAHLPEFTIAKWGLYMWFVSPSWPSNIREQISDESNIWPGGEDDQATEVAPRANRGRQTVGSTK